MCLVLLLFTSSGWTILDDETSVLMMTRFRMCCFSSPEEQLSKLRSPRTTSKATRSSSTFSPSGGWDEDWRNSAPHWSNRSSCSQRMEASPDRQCAPGREKEEEEQVKCKLLQNVCSKVGQACRIETDLNRSTKEGVRKEESEMESRSGFYQRLNDLVSALQLWADCMGCKMYTFWNIPGLKAAWWHSLVLSETLKRVVMFFLFNYTFNSTILMRKPDKKYALLYGMID